MKELVRKIEAEIAKYRMVFGDEKQMQDHLWNIFEEGEFLVFREQPLSPADRPDFSIHVGPRTRQSCNMPFKQFPGEVVCLEVKVGGSVEGHLRQMKRYNTHEKVVGTILISTRKYDLPESLAGKPVACVSVGGNRL